MKKMLAGLFMSIICAGASASGWPWQGYAGHSSSDYCMGFVVGGLASHDVGGMDRSELWQAWSYLIRSGAMNQVESDADFEAGKARFADAADTAAASAALEETQGDCGLGRSGHQITGW